MSMHSAVPIGRIAGIRIAVDWSWMPLFLFVVWSLGVVVFTPLWWGPATTWTLAVVAALLFFASVLAHEVARALVARAQGLSVRTITLFLFGGISTIQQEPPSPRPQNISRIPAKGD
jgi:Zn-dependent protease